MGQTDLSKQARAPPAGLRTQRDLPRVSPAWRLRTRSYSHDNELYRMGLNMNADGEWGVVRNRVPQCLVDAMREVGITSGMSERGIQSRSQSILSQRGTPMGSGVDVDMKAADLKDGMKDVGNYVIDLTDDEAAGFKDVIPHVIDLTDDKTMGSEEDVKHYVIDLTDSMDSVDSKDSMKTMDTLDLWGPLAGYVEDGMEDIAHQVADLTNSPAAMAKLRVYLDLGTGIEGGICKG